MIHHWTIEELTALHKRACEYFDSWHERDRDIAGADHDPDVALIRHLIVAREAIEQATRLGWSEVADALTNGTDNMEDKCVHRWSNMQAPWAAIALIKKREQSGAPPEIWVPGHCGKGECGE